MSTRVLIIEDDDSILEGLTLNLEAEGYEVTSAKDGHRALSCFEEQDPDLVLLDLMLPAIDGFEVLQQIREKNSLVPVLILSARETQADKVQGLGLGADDYVTKPFALPELLARIKAALRRTGVSSPEIIQFGAVQIMPDRRRVKRRGEDIDLTAKEYDLLLHLLQARDRVLTRAQILEQVWGADYEGTERTVDNFIARLRNKLEDNPESPRHILTVRGVGYRLTP